MPDVRLREYTARVQDLLLDARYDEAIVHCRHVLSQYPRHIGTYCQLGEACLEKGLHDQAKGFFQRALSADPENLMARVGMGLIEAERGTLPEAIWHMMRAHELAPGNAEVRQELRQLYLKRDGKEKGRIELTRGALGRLYARGALFPRAAAEFRAVLSDQPDLVDVRVALAETLWREGRRLEAVETSLDLIEVLPDCLKANLILGEIWMRSGHTEAAEEKLEVARALDPENQRAQEMMGRDSPLTAEEVWVLEPETAPGVVGEKVPGDSAEWLGQAAVASAVLVSDGGEPADGPQEVMPSWLAEFEAEGEDLEAEPASAEPDDEPPVPEWLRAVMTETDEEEDVATLQMEAPSERAVAQPPKVPLEVPDWLRELEVGAPAVATAMTVDAALDEAPSDDDDLVHEAVVEEKAPPAVPEEVPEEGETPTIGTLDKETETLVQPPAGATEYVLDSPDGRGPGQEETEPGVHLGPGVVAEVVVEGRRADDALPQWVREMETDLAAEAPTLGLDETADPVAAFPYAIAEQRGEGESDSLEEMPTPEEDMPSWVRELEAIAARRETVPVAEPVIEEIKDDEVDLTPEERSARVGALVDQLESGPAGYAARMELARLHGEGEDWDSALGCYEELIAAGERLPEVITDMKRLEGKGADQERFYRLMGDAHIKSNQLEEAAEMYRLAREALE